MGRFICLVGLSILDCQITVTVTDSWVEFGTKLLLCQGAGQGGEGAEGEGSSWDPGLPTVDLMHLAFKKISG